MLATSLKTSARKVFDTQFELNEISSKIKIILKKSLSNIEISINEAIQLFECQGLELDEIVRVSDELRRRTVGEEVSFVITRNINFTNVCNMGCKFCGFAKKKNDIGAELLPISEIVSRAQEAWHRGASEICIQGGLHPDIKSDHYVNMIKAIKQQLPDLHIHAFSPFEIWYGAMKSRKSYSTFIQELIDAGLGSMPGTAAEILDVDVRKQLTKDKLNTQQWVEIITTAHQLGLPTTATIMYGHIDQPKHWAEHINTIRNIQKKTGGFTEFVPLGFVHYESPLYVNDTEGKVRPGPTDDENLKMHAISRIMLNGWIDNIQASWVKLGPQFAKKMLGAGVNDLGGTLMNESITSASGGKHGQEISPRSMVQLINDADRIAVQRNTLYKKITRLDTSKNKLSLINCKYLLSSDNTFAGSA
ncbi:MAG: 5-amino-6-(D-ribitylamino)uracil--L-tyrosine 4-hydroxyphenyl transferase CofH [Colwellia sp.]